VVIVDDEDDIALAFKIGLEDNGFAVDTFNDPQEALLNFKTNTYDLMLLDIKMPKLNGLEFYYQMRRKDNNTKVCFITASEIVFYENVIKEISGLLGAKSILRKPIKLKELVE
jgi:DNA-binding response OmpR family regulator